MTYPVPAANHCFAGIVPFRHTPRKTLIPQIVIGIDQIGRRRRDENLSCVLSVHIVIA